MAHSFDKLCSNLIPTGKYKVQVTDAKFRTNSLGECSKDMVINYTILEGPYAKRTLMDAIYEKTFSFRLKPFLTACKIDTAREFATADEMFKFGLTSAKSKIIMIDVGIRTYNGKEYNQVTNWYPIAGSTTTAAEVLNTFNEEPSIKGVSIEDAAEEVVIGVPLQTKEPELDIDLSINEDDLPF